VYAFHIRKNRYQLLAREGDEGTAVAITDKEVFAGFVNGAIKIFDQHSGDVVATLKAHKSRVTRVEVSPAGDYLVSTSNDGAFLWDLTSPDYAKTALSGATKGTVQARFAGPTGDRVVVAFHDQSLRVYRTDSAQLVAQLDAPPLGARSPLHAPALCQSIAITPDARYVITAGGSPCLFVWDLEKKCLAHAVELPAPAQSACDAQFLPAENGGSVACVCDDGAVRVVDPFEGIVTHTIPAEESGGSSGSKEKMAEGLCVEPKGRYGAIIASKGQMRLYDLHVARAGRQKDHPKRLKTIPISADAKEAAIEAGEVAATGGPGRGSGGDEASEGQPPSPPPSKALLDAVFPPALPRAEGSGDGDAARPSAADFEKLEHVEWGPPPGTKPRLNKGRRGPMPGVAKAAPASSHVASNFPMPETLGGDFADVHKDPTVRDAMKLRNLLHAFGEFPAKYRLLTWRKMLRLPNNEVAYEALADKGIHPAIADLPDRFPISDRTLLARLQRVCSALAHWSPIFAESPIVPGMLFPFVKAFGPNEVHAFEAFATVATNHAKGWFELFPDPPFGFLGEVEAVVKYHDAALATHMETLPGGLTGAAWDLLSTLFTDVTTADEWLKLFDHVVVVGREMLQYLAVAFLAIWRDAILAAPEGSTAIKQLFVRDAGTSLPRLLEKAYELRHTTPPGMTTLEPTKIVDAAGPGEDDAPLTVAEGGIEALPRGDAYPIFLGFPKRAVDFASSERERIRAEEDAVLARQKVVKNLSARTEELRRMEAAWEAEAQRMDEIETSRRAELDQIDSSMKAEQKKWEERERIERLKQVEVIESAYQASLARKKAEWNAELDKLRDEVDRKREAHAKEMKQHTEDEQLRSLEFEAQQRLWAMEEEQAHKSALRRVEQEVAAREAVEGINDKPPRARVAGAGRRGQGAARARGGASRAPRRAEAGGGRQGRGAGDAPEEHLGERAANVTGGEGAAPAPRRRGGGGAVERDGGGGDASRPDPRGEGGGGARAPGDRGGGAVRGGVARAARGDRRGVGRGFPRRGGARVEDARGGA
jgi:WD40 repeat protein